MKRNNCRLKREKAKSLIMVWIIELCYRTGSRDCGYFKRNHFRKNKLALS